MPKVFISMPMRGKTNEEIEQRRKEIIEDVKLKLGNDTEIIDSFFKDAPHDSKPLWFLGESIKLLSTADFIVLDEGWQDARGCRIERECALEYEIGIFYYHKYGN